MDDHKWHNLERLLPYSDLVGMIGFVLLVGGIAWISVPCALIAAGILLIALSLYMARI